MRILRFANFKELSIRICGCLCFFATLCDWFYGYVIAQVVLMYPRYLEGHVSMYYIIFYNLLGLTTLYCILITALSDPGYVTEKSIERYFQKFRIRDRPTMEMCKSCNKSRPQRAHHCRRCGRCVLKMDHHCPFVGNCVGENNRWLFMLMLCYTITFTLVACVFLFRDFFMLPPCDTLICTENHWIYGHRRGFQYGSVVSVVLTLVGCGVLLQAQHRNVRDDFTTIEAQHSHGGAKSSTASLWRPQKRPLMWLYEDECGYRQLYYSWLPCRRRNTDLISEHYSKLSSIDV